MHFFWSELGAPECEISTGLAASAAARSYPARITTIKTRQAAFLKGGTVLACRRKLSRNSYARQFAVYYPLVDDLTAFILAGGKSTRMGTDKALAGWGKQTLLEHSLKLVRALSPEVLIVGAASKYAGYGAVVEDMFRDRGPLGGIQAALQASATELNMILAVDLPLMEPRFLKYLVAQARATTAAVTVPRCGEGWQPLCAVYRREFGHLAERSLREGRNKIDALFTLVETRILEENEITKLGFSARMFQNVNTPKDLEKAAKVNS